MEGGLGNVWRGAYASYGQESMYGMERSLCVIWSGGPCKREGVHCKGVLVASADSLTHQRIV